jgi:hypothetical protein
MPDLRCRRSKQRLPPGVRPTAATRASARRVLATRLGLRRPDRRGHHRRAPRGDRHGVRVGEDDRRRPPGYRRGVRHAARRGPVGRPPKRLPLDVLLADLVDIVPRCRTIYSCCRLVARAGAAHRRARRLAGGLSSRCWAGAPRNERRHSCAGWWMAAREGPRRAGRIAHEGRPPRRRSVGSARWRRGGCCASGLRV